MMTHSQELGVFLLSMVPGVLGWIRMIRMERHISSAGHSNAVRAASHVSALSYLVGCLCFVAMKYHLLVPNPGSDWVQADRNLSNIVGSWLAGCGCWVVALSTGAIVLRQRRVVMFWIGTMIIVVIIELLDVTVSA
jgi:hypothetical protein